MTDRDELKEMSAGMTFFTVALNYLPLVYLIAGAVAVFSCQGLVAQVLMALAWVYLLPILVARIVMMVWGRPQGKGLGQNARAYKVWWVLLQM